MGVVGICIHGLYVPNIGISYKGNNPFNHISVPVGGGGQCLLSDVAICCDPPGYISQEKYNWISASCERFRGSDQDTCGSPISGEESD